VVYREVFTEGSQTAKSGTDKQERYMRLLDEDKQTHHCNVRNIKSSCSRYRRHWRKGKALTRGGLDSFLEVIEKSAEAIVAVETSHHKEMEGSHNQ
jgi:hypothetical protein